MKLDEGSLISVSDNSSGAGEGEKLK